MVRCRAAPDFEGNADFVITDPAFALTGNTALLLEDLGGVKHVK